MSFQKKSKKRLPIVLAAILLVFCAAGIGFYLYASEIRFDYCDANVYADSSDLDALLESGCEMIYPFFGNSASLTEGRAYHYPLGIGSDKRPIYTAVNSPIHAWAESVVTQYQNRVKVGYTVINEGNILTVQMRGAAYPDGLDGDAVEISKDFVFDVENVNLDKLPILLNN